MGPTNYTAMDNRPGEGAHDDDWDNNVMTLVESASPPTYWSRAPELSHQVDNSAFNKTLVWMLDIT